MIDSIRKIIVILILLLPQYLVVRADEPCPEYNLRAISTNPKAGIVTILQQPSCDNDNTAIVEAIASEGYRFDKWTDGNTDNPRTIKLTSDWSLLATWVELPCVDFTITAISTYSIAGTVNIVQEPSCENGNIAIVEAIPNEYYRFTGWTDGNTDNPRTLKLTADTRVFATWEQIPCDTFLITIESSNTELGNVTMLQEPRCENENVAVIIASPTQGCEFISWSDGVTQSTRVIPLTQDTNLTATFGNTIYYIVAAPNNPDFGNVLGSGTYVYGMEVVLNAYSLPGYKFDHWGDGNTDNPRTITVTEDADYTAIFVPEYHIVTVESSNYTMGTATGSGRFQGNTYTTITARPNNGYKFLSWNDGNELAEREILVLEDITYTAYFAPASSLDNILSGKIHINNLTINFQDCQSGTLTILAANGQIIYSGIIQEKITVPAHGLYLIVIDDSTLKIML